MKAVVAAFNQEKALVGAFSVITNLRIELFEALLLMPPHHTLSSVKVPAPAGSAPVVASAARRGTNVAVSKRTRFALQVLTWVCS